MKEIHYSFCGQKLWLPKGPPLSYISAKKYTIYLGFQEIFFSWMYVFFLFIWGRITLAFLNSVRNPKWVFSLHNDILNWSKTSIIASEPRQLK